MDKVNRKNGRGNCESCHKKTNENIKNFREETVQQKRAPIVGPSFSRILYLMLKFLSGMSDRDVYIITKSPPE